MNNQYIASISRGLVSFSGGRTLANVAKIRGEYRRFYGQTHWLTLREYVALRFKMVQHGLRRCGIPEWNRQGEWLANAEQV